MFIVAIVVAVRPTDIIKFWLVFCGKLLYMPILRFVAQQLRYLL